MKAKDFYFKNNSKVFPKWKTTGRTDDNHRNPDSWMLLDDAFDFAEEYSKSEKEKRQNSFFNRLIGAFKNRKL